MDSRIKAVTFDEKEHRYFYGGKELHGITGAIGKLMGKSFPDTIVVQASELYGHTVHSESERWIKEGRNPSTEGGKWLVEQLKKFQEENDVVKYEAELLVSDFTGTASCIDIVAHLKNGNVVLFDNKTTTVFNRKYCSLQLSVYKKLYEKCYSRKVQDMYVIGIKMRRLFHILEQDENKVQKILDMNKE